MHAAAALRVSGGQRKLFPRRWRWTAHVVNETETPTAVAPSTKRRPARHVGRTTMTPWGLPTNRGRRRGHATTDLSHHAPVQQSRQWPGAHRRPAADTHARGSRGSRGSPSRGRSQTSMPGPRGYHQHPTTSPSGHPPPRAPAGRAAAKHPPPALHAYARTRTDAASSCNPPPPPPAALPHPARATWPTPPY